MAESRRGKGEGLDFVAALEGGEERGDRREAEGAAGKDTKMHIGGRFHPEVGRQLKLIAADEQTSVLALLCEGINHVFESRGKPPIAGSKT